MGRRLRWALAALVVLIVAVGVGWWSRHGDGARELTFDRDDLLVPGDDIGHGHRLTGLRLANPRRALGARFDGRGPLVVTRVGGAVVAVTTASVEDIRRRKEDEVTPDRSVTVNGRPTVRYGFQLFPGTFMASGPQRYLSWLANDDLVVSVFSRDLDETGLRHVAEQVKLDRNDAVVGPGELIGEIPVTWSAPTPGVSATYEKRVSEGDVVVLVASPQVQAAYLALAPAGAINGTTHVSCCLGSVGSSRRSVHVAGRRGTIASIDYGARILVLDGDPGIVMVGTAYVDDEMFVAIAASLKVVPPSDFEPVGPQ